MMLNCKNDNNLSRDLNQSGGVVVSAILGSLLAISLIFGIWAFMSMLDYKGNVDKKIASANAVVKKQTASEKDKEFAEKEKNPYKQFTGPVTFGSMSFQYPKTWNAFIDETSKSNGSPVDGYWYPNVVPGLQSGVGFALRVKILSQTYDSVLKPYSSSVKVKVSPFRSKNVPSTLGARLDGEINAGQKDSMVLIPIRDKTIQIWTESEQFVSDFDNVVLPSLNFIP